MDVHKLHRIDPLRKQAERGLDGGQGLSPMDPPDAYAPSSIEPVPAEALHPFLRQFRDEHVDFMEDEHAKAMQLAAVVLNFLGLAFRLPDERSRLIVLDAALEQGKNLVELLRLHVFREDNIVFSLAHRLISRAEFDEMQSRAAVARKSS